MRSKDSNPYPPKTVYVLLCGILREMRVTNPNYPNFLNKDDPGFHTFHVTLDNLFKSLCSNGIDSTSSHAEGISREEENALWDKGVTNVESPMGLLCAAFYYCRKCFCLRGRDKHRNLSLSKLECLYQPDRYIYRKNASKNRQGGLKEMWLEHKVVTMTTNKGVGNRCPVFLLDTYTSKLPAEAKEKSVLLLCSS